MKKSLLAAAVPCLFAALSVTLYGFVDTGIGYQHVSETGEKLSGSLSMDRSFTRHPAGS